MTFRQFTSGIPTTGVHLGPKLFKLFINDRDDGTERTLRQSADDTPADCAAIQRDFDTVEIWADTNPIKFNKGKRKILHLGRNNPMYQYRLGDNWLQSGFAEDDLGSWRTTSWTWASSMPLQQRWPKTSLAALGRASPSGQGDDPSQTECCYKDCFILNLVVDKIEKLSRKPGLKSGGFQHRVHQPE